MIVAESNGRQRSPRADSDYERSALDLPRLRKYATRVARETKSLPNAEILRTVTKSVPSTETRRVGFLGMRTETVQVSKQIQISEQVIGPHWLLHQTNHHIETHKHGTYTEYMELNHWVLRDDGALVMVWRWEEFTRWADGTTRFEKDCTAKPMTQDDVLRLDYSDKSYETGSHGRGTKIWGTREPGRRIRHAKGVGLSVALKKLLTE